MKKILIMIESLYCGGAEKSLTTLLPFLVEKGYKITLLLLRRGGDLEKFVPKEVDIKTFPFSPKGLRRLEFSLAIRFPLKKYTYEERMWNHIGKHYAPLKDEYDVAIAYQQGFPSLYIANKVISKNKICWINCDLIQAKFNKSLWKKTYDKFNHIVAVTNILSEILVKNDFCNKNQVSVINDIVAENVIKNLARETIYSRPKDKLVVSTVGRFSPVKGYDLAVEAAYILKKSGLNFEWNFIGDGPTRPIIQDFIKNNKLEDYVKIRGLQLNPYPFIDKCDIYVQPSRSEGYGITICEAKILQKPIVSTNFPVVHYQIKNGVNGIVAEMNAESIAENIYKLAIDPSLRKLFSENLAKENNLSSITESNKVINLIENLQ